MPNLAAVQHPSHRRSSGHSKLRPEQLDILLAIHSVLASIPYRFAAKHTDRRAFGVRCQRILALDLVGPILSDIWPRLSREESNRVLDKGCIQLRIVIILLQAKCGCMGTDRDTTPPLQLPPNLMQAASTARLAALQPGGNNHSHIKHSFQHTV